MVTPRIVPGNEIQLLYGEASKDVVDGMNDQKRQILIRPGYM